MQTNYDNDPKSIQTLMGETSVGGIIQKARLLEKIEALLMENLEPNQRACLQVLNFRDQCLVLATANTGFATQIRFRSDELLKKLNSVQGMPQIIRVECLIRP